MMQDRPEGWRQADASLLAEWPWSVACDRHRARGYTACFDTPCPPDAMVDCPVDASQKVDPRRITSFGSLDCTACQKRLNAVDPTRVVEPEPVSTATYVEDEEDERDARPGALDMSPEAVAERAERRRRRDEAMAYVKTYTGTWEFILDLRTDRKWGSKWFRLSDRQVDVILKSKARDAERLAAQANDPVVEWLKTSTSTSTFILSLKAQVVAGRGLSPKQREAVERNMTPQPGQPARVEITEGWYRVEDTIWKVQKAVHGSGNLYAKRLDPDTGEWEYVAGGKGIIARSGGVHLTVEEAKAMGRLYGRCMVCGRTLTDETSIAEGIGPICAGRL